MRWRVEAFVVIFIYVYVKYRYRYIHTYIYIYTHIYIYTYIHAIQAISQQVTLITQTLVLSTKLHNTFQSEVSLACGREELVGGLGVGSFGV